MKGDWSSKPLSELCILLNGLWKGKESPFVIVGVIRNTNFNADGSLDDSDIAYLEVESKQYEKRRLQYGDLILEKSGGGPKQPVGRVVLFDKENGDYSFSNFTSAIRVRNSDELDFRFLHKFLHWIYISGITEPMQSHSTGIRNLNGEVYKNIKVPLPTLSEQRRIVAILDEALESIAAAAANAEKNLATTRRLFQILLDKEIQGSTNAIGSKLVPLGLLTSRISDGVHKTPIYIESGIPFITVKNLTAGPDISFEGTKYISERDHQEFIKRTHPERDDLLITKDGTIGVVRRINTDIAFSIFVSVALIKPIQKEMSRYLTYALRSTCVQKQIIPQGTALKHLYLTDLRKLKIPIPPDAERQRIVCALDDLSRQIEDLEMIYKSKIDALQELKRALLKQAFDGKLARRSVATLIDFPRAVPNITTTDLHAGILAIAYQKHLDRGKQDDFGHVKAEKIAHMVESFVGIELGRSPVKDAAGPNDFPHLLKVQHRAERANYFSFKQISGGQYKFMKKVGFDRLVEKTRAALGDAISDVDQIVETMVKMDFRQAEIFATVFAAWNNLLIVGGGTSDNAIVHAARDDWHPDKLKIPAERFFEAIKWMRSNTYLPQGVGKIVAERSAA